MIQDIAPKKLHNEYQPVNPDSTDYITVFLKNKILIKQTDEYMRLPKRAELEAVTGHAGDLSACPGTYLFCIDEESYFLYVDDD